MNETDSLATSHSPATRLPLATEATRRGWWQTFRQDPAVREAFKVFLAHRLVLSAIAILFQWLILPYYPHPWAEEPTFLPYNTDPLLSFLVAPWQRWDTQHFLEIASGGYNNFDGNTVFAPLLPALMALFGRLLFGNYMLAGWLIGNAAYFVALVYLYKLAAQLFDARTARYSLQFLAFFPTAFYLLCAYTDGIYLALVLAAFYYAEKRRWWPVVPLVGLACLTRVQGPVIVLPLLFLYFQQHGWRWQSIKKETIALALAPVTLALYFAYIYFIVGDTIVLKQIERWYHVRTVTPFESVFGGLLKLGNEASNGGLIYDIVNFSMIVVFGWLTWRWFRRKLPPAYAIYSLVTLLVLLTRQKDGDLWMSMMRYVLSLFPVFIYVAWRVKKVRHRMGLFLFGAFFQTILVILFLMWKWIA
jgi:hypothetical protein